MLKDFYRILTIRTTAPVIILNLLNFKKNELLTFRNYFYFWTRQQLDKLIEYNSNLWLLKLILLSYNDTSHWWAAGVKIFENIILGKASGPNSCCLMGIRGVIIFIMHFVYKLTWLFRWELYLLYEVDMVMGMCCYQHIRCLADI